MKKLFAVLAALPLLVLVACSSSGGDDGNTTKPKTYSITGQITSNSTGLAGVTVSLSGASTAQTMTDSSGNYNFTGQSNGDYTVSPSLSGYVFSPSGTIVTISHADKAGIDFTATASTTPTYSISGTVGGAVASGVTVTLAGTSSGSTLTDASGNYSFSDIANGNYTITASKTGYTFSPVFSITINGANITGQNFTATANTIPTYNISGNVNGAVASGVTIILTGTGSSSTTTDVSGNYSFNGVANGSYTVTPSKTGYTFNPASIGMTVNNANITGQNFTASANVVPSSAKAITAYSLAGVEGTINEAAKTISVTMPTGTDVTVLVATFTKTGVSVKVGSTVQVSGTTANDFTNPVTYTVTAADASTQNYTVTVIIESANKLATAVTVSMTPNTPAPHAGIFCTATRSITGNIDVTDIDGGTNIEWEWYDNGVLQPSASGQTTVSEANGHVTTTFYGAPVPPAPEPFQYHHTIMFKVTVDGGETNGGVSAVTSQRIL